MLWLAALSLTGCNFNRTPNFAIEAPPWKIPADYRKTIVAWTQRYYVEPGSVQFLGITDPVPARATNGAEFFLVCTELDARERGGPYMGPRRIAFGFAPGVFSAPMERRIDLMNEDCDARPLAWREWREPAARVSPRRRG
ncbi:MAG TPA: hypothetical protein VF744_15200 [Beijerinckiaceae bacterium]|jgi:hypothetical protein